MDNKAAIGKFVDWKVWPFSLGIFSSDLSMAKRSCKFARRASTRRNLSIRPRGEWTSSDVTNIFPQLLLFSPPWLEILTHTLRHTQTHTHGASAVGCWLLLLLALFLFGKPNFPAFLFIYHAAHIATMYRLLSGGSTTRNGGLERRRRRRTFHYYLNIGFESGATGNDGSKRNRHNQTIFAQLIRKAMNFKTQRKKEGKRKEENLTFRWCFI